MQITVSGKHMDVGQSLTDHVNQKIAEGVSKYLDRVTDVTVVFSKEAHLFRADVLVNTGTHTGITIKGQAQLPDVYAAFDAAADKIEKQLRRYKRKLKNHHKDVLKDYEPTMAKKYVLADDQEKPAAEEEAPLIIAEKTTSIDALTVSEAVMRMDLANLPALLFYNSVHGGLNVVYRREDGNISWVDPGVEAVKTKLKKAS